MNKSEKRIKEVLLLAHQRWLIRESKHNNILDHYAEALAVDYIPKSEVLEVIEEIEREIESNPKYPNLGKRGCRKRLLDILPKPTS